MRQSAKVDDMIKPTTFPTTSPFLLVSEKWLESRCLLEAAIGIEPMNKGFADLCLTTWLRRH